MRPRHPAFNHMLHRPLETYDGDPEDCQAADDSPIDPGIKNGQEGSSGQRGAFAGGSARGAWALSLLNATLRPAA